MENVDLEFLQMTDLMDMEVEHIELALERIEQTNFDAFHFDQILIDNSLQYMTYKLF